MIIVVGLGNFGKEYEKTYHNLGFMVADALADKLNVSFDKEKCKARIAEGFFNGQKILIAKPLTFMNRSGEAVVMLKNKFKDARIIVVVDDIDLPPCTIRYRERGKSGTHNGLRSIVEFIGEDFERVRIGTGRDNSKDLADFVLSKIQNLEEFDKAVQNSVNLILEKIS